MEELQVESSCFRGYLAYRIFVQSGWWVDLQTGERWKKQCTRLYKKIDGDEWFICRCTNTSARNAVRNFRLLSIGLRGTKWTVLNAAVQMPNDWYQLFPLILLAVEITGKVPSAEGKKTGQLPCIKSRQRALRVLVWSEKGKEGRKAIKETQKSKTK